MTDAHPEAGWRPDPTGRHELRYFDGAAFTDHVADGGVQSTDPGPHMPAAAAPPPDVTGGKRPNRLPVIAAVVVALVVVVGLVTVLRDGGGDGFGTFDGEVADGGAGVHAISIDAGSVVVVEVEPDDFDAVVSFAVAGDDADDVTDPFEGTPFEEIASGGQFEDELGVDPDDADGIPERARVVFRRDSGFEGERERTFLPVAADVEAAVVVTGFDGDEGDYEITIESVELDGIDEDSDGDDLLDAILDADDVPRVLRSEIEDFLEG